MTTTHFKQIQKSISDFLDQNNLQNLKNPLNTLIKTKLEELNFVTFEEFETQKKVLEKLQEKLRILEKRIHQFEQQNVSK